MFTVIVFTIVIIATIVPISWAGSGDTAFTSLCQGHTVSECMRARWRDWTRSISRALLTTKPYCSPCFPRLPLIPACLPACL